MEISLWLLFIVTFSSALAIPGPNAAFAVGQTVSYGTKQGLSACAGFSLASGINLVVVMTGLGLILSKFINVLIYLKWIGVLYLLYMAYRAFTADPKPPESKIEVKTSRAFYMALLVSLSNPKVVLFNIMLLPLFLQADRSMLTQGVVITFTGMVLSFFIYSAYALLASKLISRLANDTASRIVGAAYLAAAGALGSIKE